MIKYTIIIPHKNNILGLKNLIDSIPRREKMQIIIVDDHSDEDIKKEILKNYLNLDSVFVLSSNENGAGAARNIGLKVAKGEWVLFADSDDLFVDNLEVILDKYCTQSNDLLYFQPITQNMKKNDYRVRYCDLFKDYFSDPSLEKEWTIRLTMDVPWSKVIKRSLIDNLDIKFESTRKQNDTIFSQKVGIQAKNVAIINDSIYIAIDNLNSITHVNSKDIFNEVVGVRIRSYLLKKFYLSVKQLKKVDPYFFQAPLRTVIISFLEFHDYRYTVYIYNQFKKNDIPLITFSAIKGLLRDFIIRST